MVSRHGRYLVARQKTKVRDSVKNKLARYYALHDYWSPLKWLDYKPEKIVNTKKQNGETWKRNKKRDR